MLHDEPMGEGSDLRVRTGRRVLATVLVVAGGAVCAITLVSLTMIGNPSANWNTVAFVSVFAAPVGIILAAIAAASGAAVRNHASTQSRHTAVQQGVLTVATISFLGTLLASFLVVVPWLLVVLAAVAFAGLAAVLAASVL